MGLGVTLSNALSGMNVAQSGLEVLSRNVSNAGTAGYNRESLNVVSDLNGAASSARVAGVQRAFDESVQQHYTAGVADSGYADTIASFLDRLQTYLGTPGSAGSLDNVFGNFDTALQTMATSPDDPTARANTLASAQTLASTLNALSGDVQGLRQETENQIGNAVSSLNQAFGSLATVNQKLATEAGDTASKAALMDQRDRLVTQISQVLDVKATYKANGTVSLMTRSGVGLIDGTTSPVFRFDSGGAMSPNTLLGGAAGQSVGTLTLTTPSGFDMDMVGQDIVQSGQLGALLKLRDDTLVQAQGQLDAVAGALAKSLSTVTTQGSAASSGAASGFQVDLSAVQPGDSFTVQYSDGGVARSVKVVRVDDTTKLPMDFVAGDGQRVIGVNFSAGAASVAAALQTALGPGLAVSSPSGGVLQVLDDGAAGTTDVTALLTATTATGSQSGALALPLFVDAGGTPYTGSLDGETQQRGFAARIAVNPQIAANDKLLVQYQAGGSLGDQARATFLADALRQSGFEMNSATAADLGGSTMSGSPQSMIAQVLNFQANAASQAKSQKDTQQVVLDAVSQRLDASYGVNVDEEMARLMELQNAYAAGARVISVVQELINKLMQI